MNIGLQQHSVVICYAHAGPRSSIGRGHGGGGGRLFNDLKKTIKEKENLITNLMLGRGTASNWVLSVSPVL